MVKRITDEQARMARVRHAYEAGDDMSPLWKEPYCTVCGGPSDLPIHREESIMDQFWREVGRVLDRIAAEKPNTYDGVKAILDTHEPKGHPDSAFFAGSGGDRQLSEALDAAGWIPTWMKASYFYAARHPETGEQLTYIEGDVERGNRPPLPEGQGDDQ